MSRVKKLLTPVSDEELEEQTEGIKEKFRTRMEDKRSGGSDDDDDYDPPVTDRWADSMEDQVGENTTMIHQNRKLLGRLDERTAWIMRILIGLFISILASITVQVVVT